jgi:hypothetical protein
MYKIIYIKMIICNIYYLNLQVGLAGSIKGERGIIGISQLKSYNLLEITLFQL